MNPRKRQPLEPRALDLVEDAIELLRSAGAAAWAAYAAGTVPFLLVLLHYWTDMSRGTHAGSRCAPGAALLAMLFLGLKLGQGVFAARLNALVAGSEEIPSVAATCRRVAEDLPAYALLLFLLVPAAILVVPLPWILALGVTLSVRPATGREGWWRRLADSVRLAWVWPAQVVKLTLLLALSGALVALNIGVALLQLPWLLKTFLGLDTPFTLAAESALNSTFVAVTAGLTWLLLDPVARAVFVLRVFHAGARTSGTDLLVRLRRAASPTAVLAVLGWLALSLPAADAAEAPAQPAAPVPAGIAGFDRALDDVLRGPEYAWRLPRDRPPEALERSFFADWMNDLVEWIHAGARRIWEALKHLFKWLDRLFTRRTTGDGAGGLSWPDAAPWWLAALAAGAAIAVALVVMRRRRAVPATAAQTLSATPDLSDEAVTADQQLEAGWLALARLHSSKGDFRLALRAVHLAALAHLAERDYIRIARHRTNRQYAVELGRRARSRPALLPAFAEVTNDFERGWYGAHPVTPETLARAEAWLAELKAC